ncbi:hypothetical protein COU20_00370 [Candidatus Kaiserbacteria bacterium CG10_big_fil_rev_8_21_14_0_10_59_10]|uniref:YibE/F family protein n=1 Tax=Candidatus Kaiserbacteria bacterium CG10_big_fil_rev_8_21_14_0_10_59_10 TaxID=1974612 RepID=A0A2H0U8N5_9BACT|nr:MAG: hypothetical protein COU20_00370 [Candidatus Kaiserbacteria bacterium CG10_big_fil_rev_8_21_14_0_10_59_10]
MLGVAPQCYLNRVLYSCPLRGTLRPMNTVRAAPRAAAAALAVILLLFAPAALAAQELVFDEQEFLLARVVAVVSQEETLIPGTDTLATRQTLRVELLSGERAGEIVTIENDYLSLREGEKFYLLHTRDVIYDTETFSVYEPDRTPALVFFTALFIIAVIAFGGLQGLRGLLALAVSLFFITYLLLPGILAGYPPVLVSIAVASLIVILGSYITHGVNRTTTAAVLGMILAISLTGALATAAMAWTRLTGTASDEAIYLTFGLRGSLDLAGLLLGGIIIGLLGVLYDAAIGQAVAVEELHRAGAHLSKRTIYARAIRIGREHIGALVNTLAIAYVGASLPLLLLYVNASADLAVTVNRELFATEIIRTVIGSTGIVLAVPITTLIAVWMLVHRRGKETPPGEEAEKPHVHMHRH